MELICPSCEARYQLPPGSIGEKGRQVSCMNCGHHWHAFPPLQLSRQGGGGAVDPSPSSGITFRGTAGEMQDQRNPFADPSNQPYTPPPEPQRDRPVEMAANDPWLHKAGGQMTGAQETSRTEQMAEIRQMLAEVQTEGRAASASAPAPDRERTVVQEQRTPSLLNRDTAAEQAAMRLAEERATAQHQALTTDRDDDDDELRRKIEEADGRSKAKATDVKKIRRKHDRRVKRKKAAEQAGSGAFLTGFLLIAMIAAVMTALYVLHPQIVERMPESRGAMDQYVATIDSLRVQIAELVGNIRDWVVSRLGDKE